MVEGLFIGFVVGLIAGVVAMAIAWRGRRSAAQEVLAGLHTDAAAQADAAVRAALEYSMRLSGAQAATTTAELSGKKEVIEARLDQVGRDLRGELHRVGQLVEALRQANAQNFGSVTAQLESTAQRTRELHDTTAELRNVLASPKLRGQWGERMADDVLRLAGMREHVNYRKQKSVEGGSGIPDVTFLLPKGHVLYLDVKFPLDAYVRHLQATSVADADAQKVRFLRDVRAKVRELAARNYASAERRALQPVLLFIPNESIFQFVYEHDPALVEEALVADVVLCSPLTLFSLLTVIRQAYDSFVTEQTSDEVLRLFGAFHEQWQRFSGHLDKLGERLEGAQRTYDELSGVRRRQLERPLDKIDDLRRSKGLAPDPLLRADAEVLPLEPKEVG
jgi:DNA recombination protein RmuC